MEKTYASIYISKRPKNQSTYYTSAIKKAKSSIWKAIKTNKFSIKNFNPAGVFSYFSKKSTTDFNLKYAISGFCDAVSIGTIKNSTKLKNFLEICTPLLSINISKSGANNMAQLKSYLLSGNKNLNIEGLVDVISEGIIANSTVLNNNNKQYGDEIPIDVIESCQYLYKETLVSHPINITQNNNSWLSDLEPVTINLVGHIKNSNGELVKSNDYMQKLGECMKQKLPVTLRIGKDIYENCYIEEMSPIITNIYELKLVIKLKYNYKLDTYKRSVFGGTILNPGNNFAYLLSEEKYTGIYS